MHSMLRDLVEQLPNTHPDRAAAAERAAPEPVPIGRAHDKLSIAIDQATTGSATKARKLPSIPVVLNVRVKWPWSQAYPQAVRQTPCAIAVKPCAPVAHQPADEVRPSHAKFFNRHL